MQKILCLFFVGVVLSLVFFCRSDIHAQQSTGIRYANLMFTVSPHDSTIRDSSFIDKALLTGRAIIALEDTIGIESIRIAITDTLHGSYTKYDRVFMYDVSGALADGAYYERKGNKIYIHLGTFRGVTKYSSAITIQPVSGPALSPYTYKKK